nr:NusA-like transcription termination signal-binding factor [Candidatus Njordarchaeum guaymaensis]
MNSGVKLTTDEIQYIRLFEGVTGATSKDVVVDEKSSRVIFVIKAGDIGLAIGKKGSNVKRVEEVLRKEVEIVEYSESPEDFVKNTLAPARIKSVKIAEKKEGHKVAVVTVEPKDRGLAIGKNGKNVARARLLASRHFGINDVVIT